MRLARIFASLYFEPWAIRPENHAAILRVLEPYITAKAAFPFNPDEEEEDCSDDYATVGKTAIVPIEGTILNKCSSLEAYCGAFSLENFKATLKALSLNPSVQNVILNISSGGGMVTGVPEASDAIAELAKSKNVYAYTNDCIASAAYWLASQCNGIFMSKSAQVGSIGVYLAVLDESKAFAQEGFSLELFKAGKFKGMGIPGTSLSDEQRAMLQERVEEIYDQFTGYVLAKRPNIPKSAMEGQMFSADEATANGLADGTVNDLDRLIDYLNSK